MAPHALRLEPAAADRARKHILHRPEGRPRTPKWPQDSGVVGGARPCCPLLLVHGQGHRPHRRRETLSTPLNMTETIQYTRTISCPATSKMPSARAHAGHLPSRHKPHPVPNVGPPPGAAQAPRQVDSATPVIRARLSAHAATRPLKRVDSPSLGATKSSGE